MLLCNTNTQLYIEFMIPTSPKDAFIQNESIPKTNENYIVHSTERGFFGLYIVNEIWNKNPFIHNDADIIDTIIIKMIS